MTTKHIAHKYCNGYKYRGVVITRREYGFCATGWSATGWYYVATGTLTRCKREIDDAIDNRGFIAMKSDLHHPESMFVNQ
jgi:uncharacterized membrane protein